MRKSRFAEAQIIGMIRQQEAALWEPLSGFLGRPAKASKSPRSNSREEFWA